MASGSENIIEKIVWPQLGKYIVAVSGGVDSVVLLDVLAKSKKYDLIVAHLDHGIRSDSAKDCELVADLTKRYGLKFVSKKAKLGPKASEAAARKVRYDFLKSIMKKHKADGIITAHHADDLLETAIFNAVRGANSQGLSPFIDDITIKRPLLNSSKAEILQYVKAHTLSWHEDSTNKDLRISRNYIRNQLLPNIEKLKPGSKKGLQAALKNIAEQNKLARKIAIMNLSKIATLGTRKVTLDRQQFLELDSNKSRVLLYYLLQKLLPTLEPSSINIIAAEHFAKTAGTGKKLQISPQLQISSLRDTVIFARLS